MNKGQMLENFPPKTPSDDTRKINDKQMFLHIYVCFKEHVIIQKKVRPIYPY